MRICVRCNKEKDFSDFTINKRSKTTGKVFYKTICKFCMPFYKKEARGRKNTGKFKKGIIPWNKKTSGTKNSLVYLKWKKAVFKRDNYVCQECSIDNRKMHAHHIKPWQEYPELRFDLDNGITLCHPCHSRLHGRKTCNLLKNGTSWAKGKKFSAEYRKKLSDAHKGVPLSEKHKEALRGRVPWNKGLKIRHKGEL